MQIEPLRGRGAFRCICGTRVTITIPAPPKDRCVGTHKGGPCRLKAEHTEPLPLCEDHFVSTGLRQYANWVSMEDESKLAFSIAYEREKIRYRRIEQDGDPFREVDEHFIGAWAMRGRWAEGLIPWTDEDREAMRREMQDRPERNEREGRCYFIRSGDTVKIGTSLDVGKRFGQIQAPNTELLATEPGYVRRERVLHATFAKFRINGEWFRLEPALVRYINALRAEEGKDPIAL